ncbi:MAG TPA: hypothetical protein VFR86_11525, partial [Burkholderiaceae bacterium]|nr:hypothetical protein [Burkholderiaceae bacterium]
YAAPAFPGARTKIVIVLAPTAPTDPPDPAEKLAPAGVWEVKVKNTSTQRVTIDAWIQRDDTPLGYSIVGRQSYFDDPQYRRFNDTGGEIELDDNATASYVRRSGTLSAIGTGARSVVVGGFRRRDGRPVKYSSLGPALAAFDGALVRPGPDAAAVCEESVTCHGVLAAGSRSGAVVAMNGTSVAAPQIARWIADRYAAGDFSDARASVAAAARLQPFNQSPRFNELAPPPARDEAGAGCIDIPSGRAQRRSGRNA